MIRKSVFVLCLFCCSAAWATCPAGYTSAPGAASTDDCYMEIQPGYYWTGTAVEICSKGGACAGGNMPYAARGAEWGIVDCGYHTVYYGATSCECQVEPLDGQKGAANSGGGCIRYGVSNANGFDIGVNEYTTGRANCYWNGTHYGVGGNNTYGCDAYVITACAAGYYVPNPSVFSRVAANCIPVESGYYSPEGATEQMTCTNALAYAHYTGPSVTDENSCPWECDTGYGLHDGACVPLCADDMRYIKTGNGLQFNLYPIAYSAPALHIKHNDTVCYGVLTPGAASRAININYNGQVYHIVN